MPASVCPTPPCPRPVCLYLRVGRLGHAVDGGNRNRHAQGSARGRGARPARRPARRFRGPGDELALYQWAHELGEPAFALEGAGSYGAGLARFLQAAGCPVYECERPKRAERRHGKSDLIDALLAARRLLGGERLGAPRGLSGPREDLRLLLLERRSAIRARTATLNQLQAVLVTAPERLRSRLPAVTASSSRARSCVCGRVRLSSRSCLASCAASAGAYSASTPSWRSSSASWRRSCRRSFPSYSTSAGSGRSAPLSWLSPAAIPAGWSARRPSRPSPAPAPSRPQADGSCATD